MVLVLCTSSDNALYLYLFRENISTLGVYNNIPRHGSVILHTFGNKKNFSKIQNYDHDNNDNNIKNKKRKELLSPPTDISPCQNLKRKKNVQFEAPAYYTC